MDRTSKGSLKGKKSPSTKSLILVKDDRASRLKSQDAEKARPEFKELLQGLITKYDCQFSVVVKKVSQQDISFRVMAAAKKTPKVNTFRPMMTPPSSNINLGTSKVTVTSAVEIDSSAIHISYVTDQFGCLCEIHMNKVGTVPRQLVQIIGLLLPQYQQFRKISMRVCRLDHYTINELCQMLTMTTLSEICLDESPVPEGNYFSLLEMSSNLTNLSLCRCNIDDHICELIASKLHHGAPATRNLHVLNLTSNDITDLGAKHLSTALRTNRVLRYLNLSGNSLTDVGAYHILDTLKRFPLRFDEISRKRKQFLDDLLQNQRLQNLELSDGPGLKVADELSVNNNKKAQTPPTSSKKITKTPEPVTKKKSFVEPRAVGKILPENMTDPYRNEDGSSCLIVQQGLAYSPGNMVLCYLNLAYNQLGYHSLKKLLSVLQYQSVNKEANQHGLMKIVLEGNYLPECDEMKHINECLDRNVRKFCLPKLTRASAVAMRF